MKHLSFIYAQKLFWLELFNLVGKHMDKWNQLSYASQWIMLYLCFGIMKHKIDDIKYQHLIYGYTGIFNI